LFMLVAGKRQERSFRRTWEYFCRKYGWGNDPYAADGVRYVLLRGGRIPFVRRRTVGTIEFVPYRPGNPRSTVEGPHKHVFSAEAEIREDPSRIWEIDKLCIAEAYQRRGHFGGFMDVFYDHAQRFAPRYYIALVERRLYRLLRIAFGLGVEQRGPAMEGPTSALIPVLFDIGRIMANKAEVSRVLEEARRPPGAASARKSRAGLSAARKRV